MRVMRVKSVMRVMRAICVMRVSTFPRLTIARAGRPIIHAPTKCLMIR
jgi:hypothetical protein